MVEDPKAAPQLCTAQYRAERIPGKIILITASGFHNTSGYKVFFQRSPLAVFPPIFSFWHVPPAGVVLDVITPFATHTSIKTQDDIRSVTIVDAGGRHEIEVSNAPDFLASHAKQAFEKDGPFP